MDNEAYRRAYKILEFLTTEDSIPEKLEHDIFSWLLSDGHREEKDAALWQLFNESMDSAAHKGSSVGVPAKILETIE